MLASPSSSLLASQPASWDELKTAYFEGLCRAGIGTPLCPTSATGGAKAPPYRVGDRRAISVGIGIAIGIGIGIAITIVLAPSIRRGPRDRFDPDPDPDPDTAPVCFSGLQPCATM